MNEKSNEIGIILSESTTREAVCQLFEEAERGGVREGMLLLIEASPNKRKLLARVGEIIPYNAFFTEGDPWSEARRKKMPVPEEVARRYEVCRLDLLIEVPGTREITMPPHPGDYVYHIDPTTYQKDIFGVSKGDEGIIWYGTQAGYKGAPIPLDVEAIPMHMAIFGVTGSGKSYDMGALIERLVEIPVRANSQLSFPLLIIDAHGDYLEYAKCKGKDRNALGAVNTVTRYVFPNAYRGLRARGAPEKLESIGINANNLSTRDLAEMIIQYYGGSASELQIHGLEKTFEEMGDIPWDIQDLFTTSFGELVNKIERDTEIHRATKGAILRALSTFREVEEKHRLFSSESPLKDKKQFVDELTRLGNIALIDFSAEAAPGVELRIKQLVITYLASMLFDEFTRYKIEGEDRYLTFAIEEAQNFCPSSSFPIGATLAKSKLSAIATQGRKFGLGLCLISQRPSFVDRIVLSMCNTFFIHRISPEDVRFVKAVTGGLPSTLAARLTKLSLGEMIVTGQMSKVPFPLVISVPKDARTVEHPAGTTEVVKNLGKLRGVKI